MEKNWWFTAKQDVNCVVVLIFVDLIVSPPCTASKCECFKCSDHLSLPLQVMLKALLYLAVNMAGVFINYLSDRTQRQSFLETRRCIEGRVRLERENHRQVESVRSQH